MEIQERSLWLMAKVLIKDTKTQAIKGSRPERDDIRKWINGHPAPWTFEDTCGILRFNDDQTKKMRDLISIRLDMAEKMR